MRAICVSRILRHSSALPLNTYHPQAKRARERVGVCTYMCDKDSTYACVYVQGAFVCMCVGMWSQCRASLGARGVLTIVTRFAISGIATCSSRRLSRCSNKINCTGALPRQMVRSSTSAAWMTLIVAANPPDPRLCQILAVATT
jgi:hypothetical protein